MKKTPDIVFVVDGVYERQAIKEANSLKLKTFAVLNTNGDDTIVDNCIPANTNSVKSIEFLLGELAPAISKVTKTESTNASRVKKVTEKKVERKPAVKKMKKDEENSEK
jgi:30S ribosomal protein S2